jgi:GAF domain-containing protein
MARLDRLGPAKEVAQIGATIGREFSHTLLAAVVRKPEAELTSALDRLIAAGLLFRQGMPPHASYLFKHALVQDAAYGTLLREARRALHARIAETLESQFPDIAESQPELLARHCTEAGLIEKAVSLWGKAGQRSLERSALVEAVQQFTRALDQIATLPATPALRREEIKLQVALITPLIHLKGFAAPETKAAAERARLLIQQAEAVGEPPEDPLLLLTVLYSFCVANFVAFNGNVLRELATHLLALAETRNSNPADDWVGNIFRWDGESLHLVATYNTPPAFFELRRRSPLRPSAENPIGRLVATKALVHVADLAAEQLYTEIRDPNAVAAVELGGIRTFVAVPMTKENELIGAIVVYRQEVRPFTDKQIALVTNFAAQAVIAIENARLLNELRQRTTDLGASLEQQTATSNVLEVISRSAFDLQAVFETVAESSVRLCGADRAFIFRFDGELLRMVVAYNATPEFAEWVANHPIRPGRHSGSARPALERRTIHIADVLADPEYVYGAKDVEAIRTILGVPILYLWARVRKLDRQLAPRTLA